MGGRGYPAESRGRVLAVLEGGRKVADPAHGLRDCPPDDFALRAQARYTKFRVLPSCICLETGKPRIVSTAMRTALVEPFR